MKTLAQRSAVSALHVRMYHATRCCVQQLRSEKEADWTLTARNHGACTLEQKLACTCVHDVYTGLRDVRTCSHDQPLTASLVSRPAVTLSTASRGTELTEKGLDTTSIDYLR